MNEPFNLSNIFSEGFTQQRMKSTTCNLLSARLQTQFTPPKSVKGLCSQFCMPLNKTRQNKTKEEKVSHLELRRLAHCCDIAN